VEVKPETGLKTASAPKISMLVLAAGHALTVPSSRYARIVTACDFLGGVPVAAINHPLTPRKWKRTHA
jgi:hypothetical protein